MSFDELYIFVDELLSKTQVKCDEKNAAFVWLYLAQAVKEKLSPRQVFAIQEATRYWTDKISDEQRVCALEPLLPIMDYHLKAGTDESEEAAINRIVSASLMTTAKLDKDLADLIIEVSNDANIDALVVKEAFEKSIYVQ